jgi:uncharacterized membrane protein YeaQ/YmgE (transglycosylase-associated protein family)
MKLIFGLIGAVMLTAFLSTIVVKVQEPALIVVVVIGILMAVVDLWQARNEADT